MKRKLPKIILILILALIVIVIEPVVTKRLFNIHKKGRTSSLAVTLQSGEGKGYILKTILFKENNVTSIESNLYNASSINLSENTNSQIFTNREYIKTSSSQNKALSAGSYNITLISSGYTQKNVEVNLKEGYDVYVELQFFKIPVNSTYVT